MDYRTTNNCVFSCVYHIVFCPKYRRRLLVDEVEVRLKVLIIETIASIDGAWIQELEIMPDHVHLLIEVSPKIAVKQVISRIKGASSRKLREEFPHLKTRVPTLWTNSYFVSSVGGAPLEKVKDYIANQKRSQLDTDKMG